MSLFSTIQVLWEVTWAAGSFFYDISPISWWLYQNKINKLIIDDTRLYNELTILNNELLTLLNEELVEAVSTYKEVINEKYINDMYSDIEQMLETTYIDDLTLYDKNIHSIIIEYCMTYTDINLFYSDMWNVYSQSVLETYILGDKPDTSLLNLKIALRKEYDFSDYKSKILSIGGML